MFIGLIDVDSVINELFKLLIELFTIFFIIVIFLVDSLDIIVVLLIVRTQFSLLFKELFGSFELLLPFLFFLLDNHCYFPKFLEFLEL